MPEFIDSQRGVNEERDECEERVREYDDASIRVQQRQEWLADRIHETLTLSFVPELWFTMCDSAKQYNIPIEDMLSIMIENYVRNNTQASK